jgi:hypothetical protein
MTQKEDIKKEVKKYAALEAVAKSEGGKILIDSLQKDVVSAIDELAHKYKDASHMELIAIISKMHSRLLILRTLNRAGANKKFSKQELEFLIDEEGE